MYTTVLAESLMHCRECLLFFAINRKRLCQTLSSVEDLIIVLLFGSSIRSYRKINKVHERSLRLCHNDYPSSYDELLSKQDLANIYVTNIHQLMVEIFKCIKGIWPPIISEIFWLRNIPYTIRNQRDHDSRLPKTVYCGLETMVYKGPRLW